MKSNQKFNGLNGVENVTRNEIIEIIELAKQENNLSVIYRLSRILNLKPDADLFNVEIIEYPKTGLNGAQHTGDYKEALDDCGRLKKGYRFVAGKVVKVVPKAKPIKNAQTSKKSTAKSVVKVGKKQVAPVVDESKFLGYDVENFDLKTAYDFFNKKLYNNELPKILLGYKAMKNKAGIAGAKVLKSGRNAKILSVDYIYLTSSYKFSNEQKLNTFIHEMIHVYLFSKGIWNTSGLDKSHGREFIAEKNRLDKILNTEIPISENIVDCEFKGNIKKVNVILIKSNLGNKYSIAVFDEKVEILDKEINLKKKLPNNTFYFLKTKSATANKYSIQRRKQNYYTYGTTEKDFNEILNDVSTINLIPESESTKVIKLKPENKGEVYNSLTPAEKERYNKNREPKKQIEKPKYDFIFEVSHAGGYTIKSFLDLPLSRSVKNKEKSDSVDGLFYYKATENGLNELKKAFPNNRYGDKQNLSHRDLNKPLSLFGGLNSHKENALHQKENASYSVWYDSFRIEAPLIFKKLKSKHQTLKPIYDENLTVIEAIKRLRKKKLNAPVSAVENNSVAKNTLAYRLQNKGNVKHDYYKIENKDIANFLGNVEKKTKESVAITIAGGQGSMKTRLCFQLMNTFAQNYKVGHASIEEHPESALYEDKIHQYLNAKALHNISAPEINSIDDVHKLVKENDVIIIDSFSKLQEMQKGCELDKDFRKAYDGKLFIIIYQLTGDGKMRGGSKSQFDGDIISFIQKEPNFKDNYCYHDKNRYNNRNLEDLKFNIFSVKLTQPETEKQQEVKPESVKFSFNVK